MSKKPTALVIVLCAALIADIVVLDDKKHTEPREPRDTVARHLAMSQLGAALRQKPPMVSIMRETSNEVPGDTFMHGVTYSLNDKVQIIRRQNRAAKDRQVWWEVRHITDNKCGEWFGDFDTAEEAYQKAA